jgi:hypothetical protein
MPFTYAHYNHQTLSKGQMTSWNAQGTKKIPSLSLSPNAQLKIAKLPKIRKASIRFAQFKIAELQD